MVTKFINIKLLLKTGKGKWFLILKINILLTDIYYKFKAFINFSNIYNIFFLFDIKNNVGVDHNCICSMLQILEYVLKPLISSHIKATKWIINIC